MLKMSDETYEFLKKIVQIVLPAFITLVATVGQAFGWDGTDLAVIILGAVTTFLGSCLKVSNDKHQETHITLPKANLEK